MVGGSLRLPAANGERGAVGAGIERAGQYVPYIIVTILRGRSRGYTLFIAEPERAVVGARGGRAVVGRSGRPRCREWIGAGAGLHATARFQRSPSRVESPTPQRGDSY